MDEMQNRGNPERTFMHMNDLINKHPEPISLAQRLARRFGTLTIRWKAVLLLVPTLIAASLAFTFEAIRTERELLRTEMRKQGETLASLASRNAELALLSENREQMQRWAQSLTELKDIDFAALYNNRGAQMLLVGDRKFRDLKLPAPVLHEISFTERSDFFEFTAPVFSAKTAIEFAFFEGNDAASLHKEHVGWVRIGLSKAVMRATEQAIIGRNSAIAVAFTVAGILLVYFFISFATKPLRTLHSAVRDLREGEYPEICITSPGSEIGRLSSEFNKMSRAIKDREDGIRASKRELQALFERVEHAIFRLDVNGTIIKTNKMFDQLCGEAFNFNELFRSGEGWKYLAEAPTMPITNWEERIFGPDKTELVVIMSLYPDLDEDGGLTGFDGFFIDITEKKRLEDIVIQTQKMESVGLLAGGIAHDFNNILTGVLGYSSMLRSALKDNEKLHRYAEVIEKSAIRASGLTQQLLGFARKGNYKMELFQVNEVVRELVHFLRETLDRNIAIIIDTEQNLPPMMGDSTQLYQALLNLCINARDAMPEGGRLYLKTEYYFLRDEKLIDLFHIPAGEYLRVSVTDTGEGMSAEVRKRIFEPFYTTKSVGKGTGLGLAMVYGIIKSHHGYLNVYSEPGLGTTMRIYLPRAEGHVEEQSMVTITDNHDSKATILLVDDEDVVRELARDILEAYNYRVFLAIHGNEGIRIFNEHKNEIDLVILDMIMPEKGGKQVFRELRDMKPDVKVLISSGYGQDEYFHEMFDAGIQGFLQKPFLHGDLVSKVEEALRTRLP